MNKQLFDASEFDEFVNEDCPDECSTEHAPPEPDCDGQWQCPESGNVYTLDDGEFIQQTGRYRDTSQRMPNGEWYIYPGDHGWSSCCDCGEYVDEDYLNYDRHGESAYCNDCYPDNRDYYGEEPQHDTVRCDFCTNRNITIYLWNPLTEEVACAAHVGQPGLEDIPVLVAA